MKKTLTERDLVNLILCDPITKKGRQAAEDLEITQQLTHSYFYEHLRVDSAFSDHKEYNNEMVQPQPEFLYGEYTVSSQCFEMLKNRWKVLNSQFSSDKELECVLIINGVAGNGKSIEVNRRLFQGDAPDSNTVILDIENSVTEVTWGSRYVCPNQNSALSLFCTKLLDQIKRFIIDNHSICEIIAHNFRTILQEVIYDDELEAIFRAIGNYGRDRTTYRNVFGSICNMLKSTTNRGSEAAKIDIQHLTELLLLMMFCSDLEKKHYLVIDNIEEYIKLDPYLKIQILDADIEKIFIGVRQAEVRIHQIFQDINGRSSAKSFKVIVVLRRTSIRQLGLDGLTNDLAIKKTIHDLTGHILISDIWDKKCEWVWNKFLMNKYDDDSIYLFGLVNDLMHDGEYQRGFGYQQLIAPLVCHSIRRGAKSQIHSVHETFKIINNDDTRTTINRDQFKTLLDKMQQAKYMYRMALLQFQFKQYISASTGHRWKWLNIGHIVSEESHIKVGSLMIAAHKVQYLDMHRVTLMRRILTVLSQRIDVPDEAHRVRTTIDMFDTFSLFSLTQKVFTSPIGQASISPEDFSVFAKVLISLGDMAYKDTKGAPFAMLQFKNFRGGEEEFAQLLKKIWDAGESPSRRPGAYDCMNYGIRITEAGYAFLSEWQASYPFMEALYCYTIPPLFFLRHSEVVKYVISTVYEQADDLCRKYENEARVFCGGAITLRNGNYLPSHLGADITFRQRVKELHCKHLDLYRNYIKENAEILQIEQDQKNDILVHIQEYMTKYSQWDVNKECF